MPCCFIPTNNRNKYLNFCTNLWSLFVLAALLIGLGGGLLMYISSMEIGDKLFAKIETQIEFLNKIGRGDDLDPEEVMKFLEDLPEELRYQIQDSLPDGAEINARNIQKLYREGYEINGLLDPDAEFTPLPKWADATASEYADDTPCEGTSTIECAAIKHCQFVEPADGTGEGSCEKVDWEEDCAPNCDWGWGPSAKWENYGKTNDVITHADGDRRRMFDRTVGGLPTQEDVATLKLYQEYVILAIVMLGLLGPIFTTCGMIFFCCQLKALANDEETACEECCGTIMGCIIFPAIFLAGSILSLLAAIFMSVMCAFLVAPFQVVDKMMYLRSAVENLQAGEGAPADMVPVFQDIYPLIKEKSAFWSGDLCKTGYLYDYVLEEADKELCEQWLQAYRYGVASQVVACVFAFFGLFLSVYVGYKACCKNHRNRRKRYRADVEMA